MPHPVCEPASLAVANLYEVLKHSEFIDSVEERKAVLEKLCANSEAELHKAQEALKPVKAEYDKVKKDLDAKNRVLEDQKLRALNEINECIARAQGEFWDLQEKIEDQRQAIKAIDASMHSLHRRLHLGA